MHANTYVAADGPSGAAAVSAAPKGVAQTAAAVARTISTAAPAQVVLKAGVFSHEHARAISRWVLRRERAQVVVIDLSRADDATTAAFAALVVLRRALLRDGRDLRIAGMRDRTRQLYSVNRLDGVLPKDGAVDSRD